MLLSLKSIAWNETLKGFFSPSHQDFIWPSGIVVAGCEHAVEYGGIGLECTCGIHSSPNIRILKDYQHFPNSIIVLLNLYGDWDLWTGPADMADTYVLRSWGAQVVGVALEEPKNNQRFMSSILASQFFGVEIDHISTLENMIRQNWIDTIQIDPYQKGIENEQTDLQQSRSGA